MASAGRPQGRLKGETEQANDLARFVREVTSGLTVRELARRYPGGKTSWSEYRSAEKDIPWHLLQRLIHDRVTDPRARAVLLARAGHLHEHAGLAARGLPSPTEGRSAARQALELARQAQRQAEAGVAEAEELIRVLVAIVAELRGELGTGVEDGTTVRAPLPADPGGAGGAGGAELRRVRLVEATRCLDEVRRIRESARDARRTAEQEQRAVGLLVDRERSRAGTDGDRRPGAEPAAADGVRKHLPVLRRLNTDLVAVRAALADRCLDVVRMTPATAGPTIVRGELVPVTDDRPTGSFAPGPTFAVQGPTFAVPGPTFAAPPPADPVNARRRRAVRTGAAVGAAAVMAGVLVLTGVLVGVRLRPASVFVGAPPAAAGSEVSPTRAAGDGPSAPPTGSPSARPSGEAPATAPPPEGGPAQAAGTPSAPVLPGTAAPGTPPAVLPEPSGPSAAAGSERPAPPSAPAASASAVPAPGRLGGTPLVPPTGPVAIRNANSLQCVATPGGSREEGALVQQYPCGDFPDHFWEAQQAYTDPGGDTYYRIISYNSARCLAVRDSSTEAAAQVVQSVCGNSPAQSWRIEKWPHGIRFVNGNSRQCLAVSHGSNAPAAPLMQYPCGDYPDHHWDYGPHR
ncbi:RICIN domain-containing protein [Kitasatospora sp. NPDC056651]|uniref:RICIN domain-containing protein n=1 Tax=Kitasatospora sp. NPDC056651 TaxID=3345892 RepID=UPI00368CE635